MMADETLPTGPVITNSLIHHFRKSIIWLYVVTVAISIPVIYFTTRYQVYTEANKELSLLVDMVASVREYVASDVRPGLLQANMFESPGISGTVAISMVASHFKEKRPDYYIKAASDNPLNPRNLPEPLEAELLTKFRANRDIKGVTDAGEIKGNRFLLSSRPSVANQECMVCHGDPQKSPSPITSKYGTTRGYNYRPDSVVGTIGVGVPLADVNTLVTFGASLFMASNFKCLRDSC